MLKAILDFEDKSLKEFFFSSNQLMCIVNTDLTSILEVNDSTLKSLRHTREDFFLHSVDKTIPQKEQQKIFHLMADQHKTQLQAKKEISLFSRYGKIIFAEATACSILYNGENAVLLTMTDITEKKLYRAMLEEAVEEEICLKNKNKQLKNLAFLNFHLARKPLANIMGLVNVLDQTGIADQTLAEAIDFLRESSNELDELIKRTDPQLY